jgi:hypothetical protein
MCNHLGSTTVFRTWPRIRRVCGDPVTTQVIHRIYTKIDVK